MDLSIGQRFSMGLSLGFSMAAMATAGSLFAFAAFSEPFRETLGYDGTEINIISSAGNTALYLSMIITGPIYDRFGARWTLLLAALTYGIGYLLMYLTFIRIITITSVTLMAFYYFLAGMGSSAIYLAIIAVNIHNYAGQKIMGGLTMGFLLLFYGLSATIYSQIYASLYIQHNTVDTGGFLLFLTLSIFVINLLAAIFVVKFDKLSAHIEPDSRVEKKIIQDKNHDSFIAILKNPILWLYIMVNIFQQGLTYMSNVSIILNSVSGIQDKKWVSTASSTHVTILSVGQSVGRFVFGYISSQADIEKYKFLAQTRLLLYIEIILIIPCLFLTLIEPTHTLMYMYSAIIGLGWGASGGLFPGLTNKFFGMNMYGTACGLIMAGVPLGIIASNQSFGALYDAAGGDKCQNFCFRTAFLVSTVFQSCCIGFTLLLCIMFSKRSMSLYLL